MSRSGRDEGDVDAFLDEIETYTLADWRAVHRRFEQVAPARWGRVAEEILDAARRQNRWKGMTPAQLRRWDEETDRQRERELAIVARLPRSSAGDADFSEKMKFVVLKSVAAVRLRGALEKTEKGRTALAMLDALLPNPHSPHGARATPGGAMRRTSAAPAPRAAPGSAAVARTYAKLVTLWEGIQARHATVRPAALTHGERMILELYLQLDGEFHNGGLRLYLENSAGDGAEHSRAYLAEIGAWTTLAVLDRIAELFPEGVIPSDRAVRRKILAAAYAAARDLEDPLGDANVRYAKAQPQLYRRMVAYVAAHGAEFDARGRHGAAS